MALPFIPMALALAAGAWAFSWMLLPPRKGKLTKSGGKRHRKSVIWGIEKRKRAKEGGMSKRTRRRMRRQYPTWYWAEKNKRAILPHLR